MKRLGFNVSINTDNRLMSRTSMSNEITNIADGYSWTLKDLEDIALNGIGAAFCTEAQREEIASIIRSRFKELA